MTRRRTFILIVAALWCGGAAFLPAQTGNIRHFQYASRSVAYEELDGAPAGPIAILLPGTSGPAAPYYQERAKTLQESGMTVLILHYFDATQSPLPSDKNYEAWVGAVQGLLSQVRADPNLADRKIALVGYSLGASIALAAGSQALPVEAIAEWYGSLPDSFFHRLRGMPPLLILHGREDTNIPVINAEQLVKLCAIEKFRCESHLYPGQAHGFVGADLADADQRTISFLTGALK